MNQSEVAIVKLEKIIRWAARIWSLLSLGFIALFFFGEMLGEPFILMLTTEEWIAMIFFPIGLCLGLIIAWRWQALGGGIALISMLAFCIWNFIMRGRFPSGPFFFLLAAPGILFCIEGWLCKRRISG